MASLEGKVKCEVKKSVLNSPKFQVFSVSYCSLVFTEGQASFDHMALKLCIKTKAKNIFQIVQQLFKAEWASFHFRFHWLTLTSSPPPEWQWDTPTTPYLIFIGQYCLTYQRVSILVHSQSWVSPKCICYGFKSGSWNSSVSHHISHFPICISFFFPVEFVVSMEFFFNNSETNICSVTFSAVKMSWILITNKGVDYTEHAENELVEGWGTCSSTQE